MTVKKIVLPVGGVDAEQQPVPPLSGRNTHDLQMVVEKKTRQFDAAKPRRETKPDKK